MVWCGVVWCAVNQMISTGHCVAMIVVCSQPDDLKRKSCEQAVGNVIQGHSRWARARSPGIFWAGVGNRFVSNTIRHTPDMAIYGGGNQAGEEGGCDNLFQDNTISRAMFETTDTGVTRPLVETFSSELPREHGQKSRGKREKIEKNRGKWG